MNQEAKRHYLLNLALLIPIMAWLMQLCLSYALGSYWCGDEWKWMFHTISLLCLLLATAGLYLGWRAQRLSEQKILSQGVIGLAFIFILLIIVSDLANFMLEPCQ